MKPMAVRTLIDAVKAGNALIIFPEGRHHRHRQPDEGL